MLAKASHCCPSCPWVPMSLILCHQVFPASSAARRQLRGASRTSFPHPILNLSNACLRHAGRFGERMLRHVAMATRERHRCLLGRKVSRNVPLRERLDRAGYNSLHSGRVPARIKLVPSCDRKCYRSDFTEAPGASASAIVWPKALSTSGVAKYWTNS